MKYIDEYRRQDLVQEGLARILTLSKKKSASLMEVCGTHTTAVFRSGLRRILPEGIRLLSGPGCPVCVTPNTYMDRAVAYARRKDAIVATFGDMFRVPGSSSSLEREKSEGADVRMVYSPIDSLKIAEENPSKKVVFLGVGFETTVPTVAATVLAAEKKGLKNFHVLCGHKTMPAALEALAQDQEIALDGLILPGHVSAIIGTDPYRNLAGKYGMPSVVTGFEPLDIVQGVYMLLKQLDEKRAEVEIQYTRTVRPGGNPKAMRAVSCVFRPCDSVWRGIGRLRASGLEISPAYEAFDAQMRLPVEPEPERAHPGCRCGEVLKGTVTPRQCPLFGRACTPETPVGACMVSSEGACAAHFRYGKEA